MRVLVIPLGSEWRQVSVEVMAVHNLSVSITTDAVKVVPHSDAVVDAGSHQFAACLRAEVCTVDQARVFKASKLTGAGNAFTCTQRALCAQYCLRERQHNRARNWPYQGRRYDMQHA